MEQSIDNERFAGNIKHAFVGELYSANVIESLFIYPDCRQFHWFKQSANQWSRMSFDQCEVEQYVLVFNFKCFSSSLIFTLKVFKITVYRNEIVCWPVREPNEDNQHTKCQSVMVYYFLIAQNIKCNFPKRHRRHQRFSILMFTCARNSTFTQE